MGMSIRRANHPRVLDYLKNYLLPDNDLVQTAENTIVVLKEWMTNSPDAINILVCVDEEDKIHGFIISVAPAMVNYVFINQCWTDSEAEKYEIASRFLDITKQWATQFSRTAIRMETSRDPRGFMRKYEFKQISATMELVLKPEFVDVETVTLPENSNGQEQRTENGVSTERVSEDSGSETRTDASPQAGEHSGAVLREDGSGSDSTVRSGNGPIVIVPAAGDVGSGDVSVAEAAERNDKQG